MGGNAIPVAVGVSRQLLREPRPKNAEAQASRVRVRGPSGRSGRKACGSRDVTGTNVPRTKDQGGYSANAQPSQTNIGRQCHTTGCSAEAEFSYAPTISARERLLPTFTAKAANAPVEQTRKMSDVTDGLSNTLFVADKQCHPTVLGTAGDNEVWNNSGWDQDHVRFGDSVPQPDSSHPDSTAATFWSVRFGSSAR